MRQNEIQNRQLRANMLGGMLAAIAEILSADGAVHRAGEEVIDTAVSGQQPSRGVPLPQDFLCDLVPGTMLRGTASVLRKGALDMIARS